MAYTTEVIVNPNNPVSAQPSPQMREERVVDPYSSRAKAAKIEAVQAKVGQSGINSAQESKPVEETTGTPEETVTLSPQMAALARKEQRFRQREQAIKDREIALEARNVKLAKLEAMETKLAAKDYSGIEELVKYDEYTNYLIEKESNLSPEQLAVKKLADEVEALKASQKDDVAKRFDAAVQERRKAVTELVATKPEFSKIKKAKAEEAVVKHILDTWENDNEELSVEQAAKEVEEILTERAQSWKALLEDEPSVQSVDDGEKKILPPLKPQIKTLTNNMAASSEIKRPLKSFSNMSDAERYAEARRRADEKLKQGIRT
jgi:hypothetical protein